MVRTIAVDLDEVIGSFIVPLCEFHNEHYGTNLSQSAFFSYAFADVWGGTREESIAKVFKFFESKYFQDIPCIPGAKRALDILQKSGFELVIVTSRQHAIEQATRKWVQKHYPGIFRDIAFGNHWGKEGKKTSKKDICVALGASVLIDDNLSYATEVAAVGIEAILFDLDGEYGWNKTHNNAPDPDGVVRVKSWDDVLSVILSRP